ncbi:tRNA (adenosine(37)-N6)-threonylcarbamoyltransferase complex dimerization subunit type 1 TsaB [Candidatus Margulisiibacteriota bacterium]
MIILGINTATTCLSLALLNDHKVLLEKTVEGPTAKAEQLIPWLEELLSQVNLSLKGLQGIGIAQGPGAFTGLRIGVTTAKTLAQMLSIPLVGISTIEAYAYQFIKNKTAPLIRIILKACRDELNTALFSINNGTLVQLEEDHPEKQEMLFERIRNENSSLAGDIPKDFSSRKLPGEPTAVSIAKLAGDKIKKGEVSDPLKLIPIYSHGPNIKLSPRIHGKLLNKNGN